MASTDVIIVHGCMYLQGHRDLNGCLWGDNPDFLKEKLHGYEKHDFRSDFSDKTCAITEDSLAQNAEKLLDFAYQKYTKDHPIIFIGLDIGGIVLKQALVAAQHGDRRQGVLDNMCACIFISTPQRVLDASFSREVIVGLVSTFWHPIPRYILTSLAGLEKIIRQSTEEFMDIASRTTIISIFEDDGADESAAIHQHFTLDLAHEIRIPRSVDVVKLANFKESGQQARDIIHVLASAVEMAPKYSHYMGLFAQLSPLTPFRFHAYADNQWITQRPEYQEWARQSRGSCPILVLSGPRGSGKSASLYYIFKMLTRDYLPSQIVTYFYFDEQDCRQNSVSSMLVNIIQQISIRSLSLFSKFHESLNLESSDLWTEEDLWIQLRTIVRLLDDHDKKLIFIIDGIDVCMVEDETKRTRLMTNLWQFSADFNVQILCTASDHDEGEKIQDAKETTKDSGDGDQHVSTHARVFIKLVDCDDYQKTLDQFKDAQLDLLIAKGPRLRVVESRIRQCLSHAKSFPAVQLILHEMARATRLYSSPSYVGEHIPTIDGTTDIISEILGMPPSWVVGALRWMFFVLHPLKPRELSVAVALLEEERPEYILDKGVDSNAIPRELDTDLRRVLGTLVDFSHGEIRCSSYFHKEIQQRLSRIAPRVDDWTMPHLCLLYLKSVLGHIVAICNDYEEKSDEQQWNETLIQLREEPQLGFLEYCVQYWHVHCRLALVHSAKEPSDTCIKMIVDLFRDYKRMNILGRLSKQYNHLQTEYVHDLVMPVHYAAQFGLPNVVQILLDEQRPEPYGVLLSTLQIACRRGYPEIVEQLIPRLDDTDMIVEALAVPCRRGIDTVCQILIQALRDRSQTVEYPPELLCEAARNSHSSIVKMLVQAGAGIDNMWEGKTALHYAAIQGSLEVVRGLLELQADINASDSSSSTALHHSLDNGHLHLAEYLLSQPDLVDGGTCTGSTTLELAVRCGKMELVESVMSLGRRPSLHDEQKGETTEYVQDSSLQIAAEEGYVDIAQLLLNRGADVNREDTSGKTPFLAALQHNHVELALLLLQRADMILNTDVPYVGSPLQYAIRTGSKDIVERLLQMGAAANGDVEDETVTTDTGHKDADSGDGGSVNGSDQTGDTPEAEERGDDVVNSKTSETNVLRSCPLMDAVKGGSLDLVQLLLSHGADVDKRSDMDPRPVLDEEEDTSWSALHYAAYTDEVEIAKLLVSRGADINLPTKLRYTPLILSVLQDSGEVVGYLLGFSGYQSTSRRGLAKAAAVGSATDTNVDREDGQVGHDASPRLNDPILDLDAQTQNGLTAMHIAAETNRFVMLHRLILSKASLSMRDQSRRTPLHHAARNGNVEAISTLLLYKVDVNETDYEKCTALHLAVKDGSLDAVKLLLASNANARAIMHTGHTPLHLAVNGGNVAIVEALILAGAELNVQDDNGRTALHLATAWDSKSPLEITEVLLRQGALVDISDNYGNTALHNAARISDKEIALLLLKYGARVNDQNRSGYTPLERAILSDRIDTTELFLESGADPNLTDEDGESALLVALKYCIQRARQPIVSLLLEHRASINPPPNLRNETPLSIAVSRGPTSIAKLLLESGAHVKNGDGAILVTAIRNNFKARREVVNLLLEHGVRVSPVLSRDHLTPLGAAFLVKDADVVYDLVVFAKTHSPATSDQHDRGNAASDDETFDFNDRNEHGDAAVHLAARAVMTSILELFRKDQFFNFHARDYQGRTAMHMCCRFLEVEQMRQLFGEKHEQSRDDDKALNIPDKDGWTPLHWACRTKRPELVSFLQSLCENPEKPCRRGWTPRLISQFHGTWKSLKPCFESKAQERGPGDQNTAVENGEKSRADIDEGRRWPHIRCNSCLCYVYGIRYVCESCSDFDLCFKCYWTVKETHAADHVFSKWGSGPDEGPFTESYVQEPHSPLERSASHADDDHWSRRQERSRRRQSYYRTRE